MNLLAGFLIPTLDQSFDDSLNRNGLRACVCGLAVALATEVGVPPAWAAAAVAALLAVYEAFLAGVGGNRRTARDSLQDWLGGSLGAATALAWLAALGLLAVLIGAAAVAVPLARAWSAGRG